MSNKGLSDIPKEHLVNAGIPSARRRRCTAAGTEFFLPTIAKNCKDLRKKINVYIGKINELLERRSLNDAEKLTGILIGVREEFSHSHLR